MHFEGPKLDIRFRQYYTKMNYEIGHVSRLTSTPIARSISIGTTPPRQQGAKSYSQITVVSILIKLFFLSKRS